MAKTYRLKGNPTFGFHHTGTREGFCQVHYRRRKKTGGWRYYCVQQYIGPHDKVNFDSFRFMLTTRDGEPSHAIPFPYNELPHPVPPWSRLERRVADWIDFMNLNPL